MEESHLLEWLRFLWEAIREKLGFPRKDSPPKTECHEIPTRKGIFRISKESFDFILFWESYQPCPYVPGGHTESGISVGYGYDLGCQNAATVQKELAELYSVDQINRLAAVTGKKGDAARAALPGVVDIRISPENAMRLALITSGRYAEKTVGIYPQVMKFHPHCQGALLSLVINRGASLGASDTDSEDSRREMREIQEDFIRNTPENIPGRLESMKRLWQHSGQAGLLKRRDGEAKLFREGLGSNHPLPRF
jgi:GH24 family phage-related lysozyme (muramidase)